MRTNIYYKRYLLMLLMSILAFNFVDRFALGLVLQDVKRDLQLTDTQLGLLSGIAFALFYSVLGVPIARWADRGNRVTIISVTTLLWSGAVALCGMAGSFIQLMLIRVAVAVGEAGTFAPALSLISDGFERAERPRAVAIHGLGGPLSAIVGYLFAGWLNARYGWRVMFMLLGLPGLVLACVAWFTLKEPRLDKSRASSPTQNRLRVRAEESAHDAGETPPDQPTFKQVCVVLWTNVTFRRLLLCLAVLFFFAYGILQWQPTFFIRSYGLTSAQLGAWLAAIYGGGGLLGQYLGGELASRYAARQEKRQLRAVAITIVSCGVLSTGVYLSTNAYVAFSLLGVLAIAQATINGPLYATLQSLVPERMRAVSIALVLLFANLIGMGFGPLATGALSDLLRPWAAEESLRYALLILSPGYLLVGWLAWRASRTVSGDLGTPIDDGAKLPAPELDPTGFQQAQPRSGK
jgi:MFS transporter, Spinster family, sphingosine-1-phosphate transporter